MHTQVRFLKFLAISITLLASILACSLPPIIVPTLVPTVSAAPAVYVATTGHDTAACGPASAPCLTVAQAVRRARGGSTIHIGAGTFTQASVIALFIPLTFIGAGRTTTILSSRGSGVFEVAPGVDIQMQSLELANVIGTTSSAVDVAPGSASLEMTRVNVENDAGIGLRVASGSLVTVSSSLFSGNGTAISNGGGLQVLSSTVFQGNLTAIYNSGVAAVDATTFTGNGGANIPVIYNAKSGASPGMLSVTNSVFSNSVGSAVSTSGGGRTSISGSAFTGSGVAVFNGGGVVTVQDSEVSASRPGGYGLEVDSLTPTISAVTQVSRTAIYGNAVGVQIDNGTASLENVTVTASTSAGIRAVGTGSANLSYTTVAYNSGPGVWPNDLATMTVDNSIIELNGTPGAAQQDCVWLAASIRLTGFNLACRDGFTPASLGLGRLTAETGTEILPLLAGSPAIDAATGACPAQDQRGFVRPYGPHCDVGAYEFGAGLHETIATPGRPTETPGLLEILPSETPTLTPTVASNLLVTFKVNGNCRKGPGTGYNIVTSLAQGQQASADGRDAQSLWVDILVPNTQAHCWVALSSLTLNVPVETLALLPVPPLPDAPATLTDKAQCVVKSKSLTVKLSWSDVSNETGYHIYRNGTLIATVAANVTTYMDNGAPLGTDLLYEIEAFNANGSSARVQTTVSACK